MMQTLQDHIIYYISLVLLILLGGILVVVSSPYVKLQMLFVVLTAIFYIAWGIIHHWLHHDLYAKIVIEYVVIGGLGIAVVFFLLS